MASGDSRNKEIAPKLGYECHILKELPKSNLSIDFRYKNSMMFIYEYEGERITNRPSQLLPYAVLKFQLENPNVHDKRIYSIELP